jgi:hypothetical protein
MTRSQTAQSAASLSAILPHKLRLIAAQNCQIDIANPVSESSDEKNQAAFVKMDKQRGVGVELYTFIENFYYRHRIHRYSGL